MCASRSQLIPDYVMELFLPLRQVKKPRLDEAIGKISGGARS
jgi:hypothetical protein